MKVRCQNSASVDSGWLHFETDYVVLFIQTYPDGSQKYLIWSGDQQCAALFSTAEFSIVDNQISVNWVVSTDMNNCLVFGPKSWMEDGFWDQYHDGNNEAEQVFKIEFNKMCSG